MSTLKDTINKISILLNKATDENLSVKERNLINSELLKQLNEAASFHHNHFINTHSCIIKNDEISLYLSDDTSYQKYIIVDSCNKDYIGEILYNNQNETDAHKYGNISYFVDPTKRGRYYALKALKLLTDLLVKQGVELIYIAAKYNNEPSIKTIESFGGKKTTFSTDHTYVYSCNLKEIKNKKPR